MHSWKNEQINVEHRRSKMEQAERARIVQHARQNSDDANERSMFRQMVQVFRQS